MKCKFCAKEYTGSECPDCGEHLYTVGATIVYGATINDASDCEITVTPKYLFIRRMSKSEKNKATAGRAFGLIGMAVAEAMTDKSGDYGWYPLSDFSKMIYPYITKKGSFNPGIKLIAHDGRELLLIFDKPSTFDSCKKAGKIVAGKLGGIIPKTEDASKQNFGTAGCTKPYATQENFDKIRPSDDLGQTFAEIITKVAAAKSQSQPKASAQPQPQSQSRNQTQSGPHAQAQSQAPKTSAIRRPCPKCGFFVLETSKFCNECGTKMQREKKCLRCGKILAENEKFCGECGYQVKA